MIKKNHSLLMILFFLFFYASCSSDDEILDSTNDPVSEVSSNDADSEVPGSMKKFGLTIKISPENSGSVNVTGGFYDGGTSIELEGSPLSYYKFKEWQGDVFGSKNPTSILIDGDKTITAVFEINHSLRTYVPDDNFEKALIALGYDDLLDDYVLTSNIANVTSLHLSNLNIRDLTGIEGFKSLSGLFLYNNEIVSLDLTNNSALTNLDCRSNGLTNLDLSKNLNLTSLSAGFNELTALDLTKNTMLKYISVSSNHLKAIDLTQNLLVEELDLMINQLTSIDLTQNTLLKRIFIFDNQLTTIDLSKNISLEIFHASDNQLSSIDLTRNTSLVNVFVNNNQLTSLDLSKNVNLRSLGCTENEISNLDLSQNSRLTNIYCSKNQLVSLDVSTIPYLLVLYCNDNQLTTLNLKNGNNSAMRGYGFIDPPPPPTAIYVGLDATNNPLLTCIQVDDADQVNSGQAPYKDWKKDEGAVYSEYCD